MNWYDKNKQGKKQLKDFELLWLRRFKGFDIPYNKERFKHLKENKVNLRPRSSMVEH